MRAINVVSMGRPLSYQLTLYFDCTINHIVTLKAEPTDDQLEERLAALHAEKVQKGLNLVDMLATLRVQVEHARVPSCPATPLVPHR
jgi:hypothetical protein